MINHIEEAYQENTQEEANSKGKLIAWIKMHKKQLALAGVGCTATLILVILGLKNKDELLALWTSLSKAMNPSLEQSDLPIQECESSISLPSAIMPRTYTRPSEQTDVRWHLRTLADGWHHSAAKKAEADAMGIVLAPNQTIVDSYSKNVA